MKKTNQVLSLLLVGFILISNLAAMQNPPWKQFYDNGNDYIYNGKLDEAYAALEGARNLNDQEPIIYWRMAQVLFLQEKRSLENVRFQRLQEELKKNPRSKKKLKDFESFHFDIDDPVKFATYNTFLEITNEARRLAKERKNNDDPDIQEQSEFLLGALDGIEALYLGLIFDEKISAGSLTLTMLSRLQTLLDSRSLYWADAQTYIAGVNLGVGGKSNWFQRRGLSFIGIPHNLDKGFPWMLEAAGAEQLSNDASLAFVVAVANIKKGKYEKRHGKEALTLAQRLLETYPDNPSFWLETIKLLRITGDKNTAEQLQRTALTRFANDPRATQGHLNSVLYNIKHTLD